MRYLIGIIALAIVAIVLLVAFDPAMQEERANNTAYNAQQQQLSIQRQQLGLEQQRLYAAATAPAISLWPYVLLLSFVAAVIAGLAIMIDAYRQRRAPILLSAGVPISRALVSSGTADSELLYLLAEAVRLAGTARIAAAVHQPGQLPAHYSPHITGATNRADIALPQPAAAVTDQATPSFADLLTAGRVGRGNPLLLGYDEAGSELAGSWLDLYSTAIAGMSGTGKTTSQRFLACQTALYGAKFAVVDPHAGAADDSLAATLAPLESVFLCEPASDDKSILDTVHLVASIGEHRIKGKDSDRTPIVLWIDELTALLGRSAIASELAELLERIAQEYRKRGVYLSASGQIWTASRTTSELRDSFASVICHRMKRNQARLLLPTEEAQQVERLSTGSAVLWRTSGQTQIIRIPNTTSEDCHHVAGLLSDGQPALEIGRNVADCQPVMATVLRPAVSAEAQRAAQLFRDGLSPAAIVLELRNTRSNEGKRYQMALEEVLGLIREGIG